MDIITVILCKDVDASVLSLPLPVATQDREAALRYVKDEDKAIHLLSAYLKRRYVGEWWVDEGGKPQSARIHFNVSHTEGAVALALSPHPVGVDIERIRPVPDDLKRYIATDEEYASIRSDEDFYRVWTSKESLVKAGGWGVDRQPRHIPALPLTGKIVYRDRPFWRQNHKICDLVLSLAQEGAPFAIEWREEALPR